MAKKPNLNKDKSVQPNVEQSTPSTSASSRNKTVPITSPNKVQKIKVAKKNLIEKTGVNIKKSVVPFNLEGEISKIKIAIPLAEQVTQEVYKN